MFYSLVSMFEICISMPGEKAWNSKPGCIGRYVKIFNPTERESVLEQRLSLVLRRQTTELAKHLASLIDIHDWQLKGINSDLPIAHLY